MISALTLIFPKFKIVYKLFHEDFTVFFEYYKSIISSDIKSNLRIHNTKEARIEESECCFILVPDQQLRCYVVLVVNFERIEDRIHLILNKSPSKHKAIDPMLYHHGSTHKKPYIGRKRFDSDFRLATDKVVIDRRVCTDLRLP